MMHRYWLSACGLLFGFALQASEPLATFDFAGNAEDSAAGPRSLPIRVGSGVTIKNGAATFDGSQQAFLDYGNGAAQELRLFGREPGRATDTLTIWARLSSRQNEGKTRIVVGRWGPRRSFQLGINSESQELDGRVTAAFTASGDWSNFVQVRTKAAGLIKHDGSQTVDVAVRFDRGAVTLFVDGVPQAVDVTTKGNHQSIDSEDESSKTVVGGIVEPNQELAAAGRSFEGIINAVRLYAEPLPDAAIAALGTGRAEAAEQNRKIELAPPRELPPHFQNPELVHVAVEDSSQRGSYLSICPDLCELADGSLLMAYHRVGFVDWDGGYSTWTRTSRDGGLTWSEPQAIAERMQAPGVLSLKSGDVLLNGCRVGDKAASTMLLFRSSDSGRTWVPQRPIWENSTREFILQGGNGSLIQLSSGRVLCPVFGGRGGTTHPTGMQAWCFYSDDDGKTWQSGKGRTIALPDVGSQEPAIAEMNDGALVMALRSSIGAVYISRSDDRGETWSEPWSSRLESPAVPVALARVPDSDRLLMIYVSGKFDPQHHHQGERTPLTAAISDDIAKTWRKLDDVVGGPHEFACSSICFTSTHKVVMGIDWHRVAWDRSLKTGGVRIAIGDLDWIQRMAARQP